MESKRKWLEMIAGDIESLTEWSKTDPDAFNRAVCQQELRKLEELAASLAAGNKKDS